MFIEPNTTPSHTPLQASKDQTIWALFCFGRKRLRESTGGGPHRCLSGPSGAGEPGGLRRNRGQGRDVNKGVQSPFGSRYANDTHFGVFGAPVPGFLTSCDMYLHPKQMGIDHPSLSLSLSLSLSVYLPSTSKVLQNEAYMVPKTVKTVI